MQKNQEEKQTKAVLLIDYKPAELKKNKDWLIVFYSKIPTQNKLKRFRYRVPKITNKRERLILAHKMIKNLNDKLHDGWSPFYEQKQINYSTIDKVFDEYFKLLEKELKDGVKRLSTIRNVKYNLKSFRNFLEEKHKNIKFFIEIDKYIVVGYFDFLYLEKNLVASSYNAYLKNLLIFFKWSKERGYINQNPVENISKKTKKNTQQAIFPIDVKNAVKKLKETDFNYYVLCMMTYYCFVRRTELTKIKVSDVHLKEHFIHISGEISKNKKSLNVTIPTALNKLLKIHLKNSRPNDFLFSSNKFKAGKQQMTPENISAKWLAFRKANKIDFKYKFYGLKYTGITDLLNTGIASVKVRDQARHFSLKMTEIYAKRNDTADEIVKNIDFNF